MPDQVTVDKTLHAYIYQMRHFIAYEFKFLFVKQRCYFILFLKERSARQRCANTDNQTEESFAVFVVFSSFYLKVHPNQEHLRNCSVGYFFFSTFPLNQFLQTTRQFGCSCLTLLWLTEPATFPLTGGLPDLLPDEKTSMTLLLHYVYVHKRKQAYIHLHTHIQFIYCGHGWHQMMSLCGKLTLCLNV